MREKGIYFIRRRNHDRVRHSVRVPSSPSSRLALLSDGQESWLRGSFGKYFPGSRSFLHFKETFPLFPPRHSLPLHTRDLFSFPFVCGARTLCLLINCAQAKIIITFGPCASDILYIQHLCAILRSGLKHLRDRLAARERIHVLRKSIKISNFALQYYSD